MVAIPSDMDSDKLQKTTNTRGLNQKFLDYFWKLASNQTNERLQASLDILKVLTSADSSESQLNYTIGRLVQGLASTRQSARHGYFVTLVGILSTFPESHLANQDFHDAVKKRLVMEGSKKERTDQQIGQILAYGAFLKSGRLLEKDDFVFILTSLLTGSKAKSYIQAVSFGFLQELLNLVDSSTFKESLWPLLKPELLLSWEEHNFDTLTLLLATRNRFPKLVNSNLVKTLHASNLGEPNCFKELTQFILRNSSHDDHPFLARIAQDLVKSGNLLTFWVEHFDAALDLATKAKTLTAFHLLIRIVHLADSEVVTNLLTKNVLVLLVSSLQANDDTTLRTTAESVLDSLKSVLVKEDATAAVQLSVLDHLLKASGQPAFDKTTGTRFIANITVCLKKEAIFGIAEIYRQFVCESSRTQDKIAVIQHFSKLMSHPAVQREVDWKASQLVFLAKWAYFTPMASKVLSSAVKEAFHRALDSPCKKLEDLSAVLFKAFVEVNKSLPDGDMAQEVKKTWDGLLKSVQKIEKKQRSSKETESWTGQVFLILYLNMGFELLRDPTLPIEILGELDTCYAKAHEKKKKRNAADVPEDPHWLEVVTDILLSLLSRNQHLLRTIVVSVWTLLAEHLTLDALQQVLDVIDPTRKETPLVDADEEEDSGESELSEEEGEEEEEESQSEAEDNDEDEEDDSDGMDEEETITDKLRMRIHEALGDNAALTDTESVDMDDLSDSEMQSLDKALSSAFQEFRKTRPVRKNTNKLPKDQTALMHFRLRCLDLIEVLTDKEVDIKLAIAPILPLLSLIETTVKEPLQKPLMDRSRVVLRKLTNIRRFAESKIVAIDDMVKLLQQLFSKPYAKRALMPYISDDLIQCCCFILRCALHATRSNSEKAPRAQSNGHSTPIAMDAVYQLYLSNLSKFFMKRDSPVPFGIFSRALAYPWPDSAHLLEQLVEFSFGSSILKNRKLLALQLLTSLFRNATALSTLGHDVLFQRVQALLKHAQGVLEGGVVAKPKYLNELFVLLRVVFQCPELASLKDSVALWEPLKGAIAAFATTGLSKQKDLKKSFTTLVRLFGVTVSSVPALVAQQGQSSKAPVRKLEVAQTNGGKNEKQPAAGPSKKRTKRDVIEKEKKEAKKRRMEASSEGLAADAVFSRVDVEVADAAEAESVDNTGVDQPQQKKKKKKTISKSADESLQLKTDASQAVESEDTTGHAGKKKKKRDKLAAATS